MDLFIVPTIGFDLLYVLVIVRLARRDLVWINVTLNPTAEWVARQIAEAFPWNEAPRYLIRDRDCVYGTAVTRRIRTMGIRDKPIAPGSPWQNGFAERLIGSIRRECVDHVVVLGEAHLRRILTKYAAYYNELRTHRSLNSGPHHICARPRRTSSPLLPNLVFSTHNRKLMARVRRTGLSARGRSDTEKYNCHDLGARKSILHFSRHPMNRLAVSAAVGATKNDTADVHSSSFSRRLISSPPSRSHSVVAIRIPPRTGGGMSGRSPQRVFDRQEIWLCR
jgi:hypothetical protein